METVVLPSLGSVLVTSSVCLVASRFDSITPVRAVRKSLTRLQRAGGRMLGVVVNQLDFAHSQKYYGEYGSSTYSYGSYGYAPRLRDSAFGEGPGTDTSAVAGPARNRA